MRVTFNVAACAALGLAGMIAAAPANAATICWAFQDLETEFWVAGHTAVIKALNDGGHTVIERNANESANKQLEQVRDCIAQGVDGIILSKGDSKRPEYRLQFTASNQVAFEWLTPNKQSRKATSSRTIGKSPGVATAAAACSVSSQRRSSSAERVR